MTSNVLTCWIPGEPATAGSKRAMRSASTGRLVVLDDCRRSGSWRLVVAATVQAQWRLPCPLKGPVWLNATFYLPRPRWHFRRDGSLKDGLPPYPITRPDRGKLLRALEDALTRIVWADDGQIVGGSVAKVWAMASPARR